VTISKALVDRIKRAAYYNDRADLARQLSEVSAGEFTNLMSLLPGDAAGLVTRMLATANGIPPTTIGSNGASPGGGGKGGGFLVGASLSGVAQDATSLKRLPATAAQWTSTMQVAGIFSGNPSALWLCQEAAGNLADSIGAFTLTAGAVPAYQQVVAGWTAKSVNTTDTTANQGFSSVSASLPNAATTSQAVLAYVAVSATPIAARGLMLMGTGPVEVQFTTTPVYRNQDVGNGANGTGAPSTTVHPLLIKLDARLSVCTLYTDQEKITPTFAANSGQKVALGGFSSAAASAAYLYGAMFVNAAAEFTDANVRSLFTALGWAVGW
jgi:hypothetical protein